jgi:site-specific DNA-methyltransferase (adenine-specific)
MKTLPNKSVDLFLCDLPYGCLIGGGGKEKAKRRAMVRYVDGTPTDNTAVYNEGVIAGCDWDIKINLDLFWVQVERLMKNDHTPIIHFCNTRFGVDLINSKQKWFRYDLVWNKSRAVGFLSANKMPMRSHELIYVFSKKGANYNRIDLLGDYPAYVGSHSAASVYNLPKPDLEGYKKVAGGKRCATSVVSVANESNKGKHPTQKPAELYKWLIERYSKEGDCVLDPTAGSFTSCFTAKELNRNAIGIEMNDAFYNKAYASHLIKS